MTEPDALLTVAKTEAFEWFKQVAVKVCLLTHIIYNDILTQY